MAPSAARLLGFHVGQVIPYGFYDQAQMTLPGIGTAAVPPALRVELQAGRSRCLELRYRAGRRRSEPDLLGADAGVCPRRSWRAPASSSAGRSPSGSASDGGAPCLGRRVRDSAPRPSGGDLDRPRTGARDRQGGPCAQADLNRTRCVRRCLAPGCAARRGADHRVDAFGSTARTSTFSAPSVRIRCPSSPTRWPGSSGPSLSASVLSFGVAVLLSPIAPLGPVRAVYPARGLDVDWTVLGLGVLALIVLLLGFAAWTAYRSAPHRQALRQRLLARSGSRTVGALASAGLPASGVVGVRMALEPGEGRAAVPVRSVMVGAVLAVALVMATITFGIESAHSRHPPATLRMELDVHPERGRRGGSERAPADRGDAGPRPRCGGRLGPFLQ